MTTPNDKQYVGLDVSQELTAICVVNDDGKIVWRGACATEASTLAETVRKRAPHAVRIGLETGQFSNWLTLSLRRRGLPVVCVDARHAKAALQMQTNKTDANDASGLPKSFGRVGTVRSRSKVWMRARCACCWWRGLSWSRSAKRSPIPCAVS